MLGMRKWSVRHARLLSNVYRAFERFLLLLRPVVRLIGHRRIEGPITVIERAVKNILFDCHMCGQCVLSVTGMSCPMNCPKGVRNGPCGGVRADGSCEVSADMRCVWVEGWSGSQHVKGGRLSAIPIAQVEGNLAGTSNWLNVIRGSSQAARGASVASYSAAIGSESRLARLVTSGEFAVTAELMPPDSADPQDVYDRAALFEGCVDALNVTDSSGANCHMSSIGTAVLLQRTGCEAVMQIACRDRNRIAIQSDILGAAALGIRNILCLTGDYATNGDHPGAKPVFDLDGVSLLGTVRTLRDEGRYLSGRALSGRPRLFLGGADNPFVPPHEFRPLRLAKKIAAGAQFVQTQYCFDVELLERYMKAVREEGLHEHCHIIVGVGPVFSARAAEWIRLKVPGVWIPQHVIDRLEGARDAREEGIRMCVDLIRQIRQIKGVAGIHLMAFKKERFIARIVSEAGLFTGRQALFNSRRSASVAPLEVADARLALSEGP